MPNVATEEEAHTSVVPPGAGVQVYLLTPRGSPVSGPVSDKSPKISISQKLTVCPKKKENLQVRFTFMKYCHIF